MKPGVYTRPEKPKRLPAKRREGEFELQASPVQEVPVVHASSECFTSPEPVVRRMIELAELEIRHRVLEPSAGTGSIVRMVRPHVGEYITAYEWEPALVRILERLVYCQVHRADFLAVEPGGQLFDRVLMNPPFSGGQDMQHVRHAYRFLKPGGRLVAVMSPAFRYGTRGEAPRFREWLQGLDWAAEDLPAGSFKEHGTGVHTVLVTIEG
jgi:protein-L-isoaspartate O-methyltransferase